jgi:hypothetical protein
MAHCPTCNSELDNNHPALVVQSLLNWVQAQGGWETVANRLHEGKILALGDGSQIVETVSVKNTYDTGDINPDDYYGESPLPQGAEFETYVVFKIGELFYKKTGTGDSYGDVNWNGDLRQVEAKPVTVWEFK